MVVLKELGQADVLQLQMLLEKCSEYLVYQDGKPVEQTAALELLNDRPEEVDISNKVVFGIYNNKDNQIIGVIDLITGYINSGTISLGLMLVEPQKRSKGIGRDAYKKLAKWAFDKQFSKIRLGVLSGNGKGLKFWENMGFNKTGDIKLYLTKEFFVLEKSL